jgi:predicted nucleotidyltransferase
MNTIDDPVAIALFPKSRREVLALLFGDTSRKFYLREVVDRTGLGVGHVQRELQRLVRGGILRRWREGRHVWFQAATQCPAHAELRALVRKTLGAVGVVRKALREQLPDIQVAFVFGSVARGQEHAESDLDLLVIGDVTLRELARVLRPLEEVLGREIHPTLYARAEAHVRSAEHFLEAVLQGTKEFVVGDQDELERLLA